MKAASIAFLFVAPLAWAAEEKAGVTVIVQGEATPSLRLRSALQDARLPIDFRFSELPNAPPSPEPVDVGESLIASARVQYRDANLSQCVSALSPAALMFDALGRGQVDVAARLLFWRAACELARDAEASARRDVEQMATMELPVPTDVSRTTPETEQLVANGYQRARAKARIPMDVDSNVTGAAIAVDGRPHVCVTPCSVAVLGGYHLVRVDADGMLPDVRQVEVNGPTRVFATLTEAGPGLAAQQWTRRYASSRDADSPASLKLLSLAVRTKRLLFIAADVTPIDVRLRGAFSDEQAIRSYAERYAPLRDFDDAARGLVEDLLVKGNMLAPPTPLYKRALFWVIVGAVAVAVAVVTYFAATPPPVRQQVNFE
jgi:hypothetical protein